MPSSRTPRPRGKTGHATIPEIISLVFVMGRALKEQAHRSMGKEQCSLLEFEALRHIKEAGEPPMNRIARTFRMTPPAATLLVEGLAKRGMIERIHDPADRRSVKVALTAKGRRFLERSMARRARELSKAFSVLTAAERTEFAKILKKITKI